eukprot:PLAT4745.2.p1 GENE.PLAT4745.2~~PLAT4745.2.p1  ORF type:complete len:641 (+),score=216.95 PLAT4745.2:280-2202(+)
MRHRRQQTAKRVEVGGKPLVTPLTKRQKTVMLRFQAELPRLPIPPLHETLERFVASAKPVLSETDAATAKAEAEAFVEEGGGELDAALREYASQPSVASYLEEWWTDSYLNDRAPCVINVNPSFLLQDGPTAESRDQVARAASLLRSVLNFHALVASGTLTPDKIRKAPLCMSQFTRMFATTRVPGRSRDELRTAADSRHIIIACRNQFYKLDVLSPDGQQLLSDAAARAALQACLDDSAAVAADEAASSAVGVLTSLPRADWAELRAALCELHADNAAAVSAIESALFLICLDDDAPADTLSATRVLLHGSHTLSEDGIQLGSCCNRWFDKSLQFIVASNGSAGINFEHSWGDGHSVLRLAADVAADELQRLSDELRGKRVRHPRSAEKPPCPQRLRWRLNPVLTRGIAFAEASFGDLIRQTDLAVIDFDDFGKLAIVALRCSPDAFVQLAFQLAYYRLYGKLVSTYESVMTKRFLHGRTECGRSASSQALSFVRSFLDSSQSPSAKADALKAAVAAQVASVKACAKGLGADRHLFAMSALADKHKLRKPRLLSGKAWKTLNTVLLSTSNCGNPALKLFAFGPVATNGFGVGYIIGRRTIRISVSSKHRQTERFSRAIATSLRDMLALLRLSASARAKL